MLGPGTCNKKDTLGRMVMCWDANTPEVWPNYLPSQGLEVLYNIHVTIIDVLSVPIYIYPDWDMCIIS